MHDFKADFCAFLQAAGEAYARHGSEAGSIAAVQLAASTPSDASRCSYHVTPHVWSGLDFGERGPLSHLASALRSVCDGLPWRGRLARPQFDAAEDNYAIAPVAGPESDALIRTDSFRFGAFAMAPDTYYPPHSHEAEELYLVLGGTAEWRMDEAPFEPVAPGNFVHHPSWASHAMHTHSEPMIALWIWLGNLDASTFRMDQDTERR